MNKLFIFAFFLISNVAVAGHPGMNNGLPDNRNYVRPPGMNNGLPAHTDHNHYNNYHHYYQQPAPRPYIYIQPNYVNPYYVNPYSYVSPYIYYPNGMVYVWSNGILIRIR